jgi:hypothetical protein
MHGNHLNFSRQILMQQLAFRAEGVAASGEDKQADRIVALCMHSQKFLLPLDGKLFEPGELRELDESQPLRLPFGVIALEFIERRFDRHGAQIQARRVIFAREASDGVYMTAFGVLRAGGRWNVLPQVFLPSTGYLDRSDPTQVIVKAEYEPGGSPAASFLDVVTLLSFLNALSCSNVHADRSEQRRSKQAVKAALPFDAYYVLTVDVERAAESMSLGTHVGPHRSPREHLRMGHHRTLPSGKRIWINEARVNSGKGIGKVDKAYRLRSEGAA